MNLSKTLHISSCLKPQSSLSPLLIPITHYDNEIRVRYILCHIVFPELRTMYTYYCVNLQIFVSGSVEAKNA